MLICLCVMLQKEHVDNPARLGCHVNECTSANRETPSPPLEHLTENVAMNVVVWWKNASVVVNVSEEIVGFWQIAPEQDAICEINETNRRVPRVYYT